MLDVARDVKEGTVTPDSAVSPGDTQGRRGGQADPQGRGGGEENVTRDAKVSPGDTQGRSSGEDD